MLFYLFFALGLAFNSNRKQPELGFLQVKEAGNIYELEDPSFW